MISHERYAELLSKHINRTNTDPEQNDITRSLVQPASSQQRLRSRCMA